jgi:hypothetical protein
LILRAFFVCNQPTNQPATGGENGQPQPRSDEEEEVQNTTSIIMDVNKKQRARVRMGNAK